MGKTAAKRSSSAVVFLVLGIIALGFVCTAGILIYAMLQGGADRAAEAPADRPGTLLVACSPEKKELFDELVSGFNRQGFRGSSGSKLEIAANCQEVESIIEAAVQGEVDAVSPDSSIWLAEIDRRWQEEAGGEGALVGRSFRYAVSPVVIAAWEDVARSLGWPEQVSWEALLNRARQDPDFKWSHPSTATASGLLATLAEFYAGAGKTRSLTAEDVQAQATLDYVAALEKTVRYYGEGELAVIQRAQREGPSFLDAFVVQEQLVIQFNRQRSGGPKLVAIYPQEGTLWEDHPMVLIEHPDLMDLQRETFERWRQYLLSAETQRLILANGYRPADLTLPLGDPITAANGADPAQPLTTLQIPGSDVIQVVRDAWWYTKRNTNVYLVVDTSGSMRGEKIARVQEALATFVQQIRGDRERVGMVLFSTSVYNILPVEELQGNRQTLLGEIDRLEASGETALLDGVNAAYVRLQQLSDRERINAIVVMTDGQENNSSIRERDLVRKIRAGNQSGVPVVIFCIAYGRDADYRALEAITEASGGQVREGTPETIRNLYKILSTYF
ncbi:MAG: VWA domain-containing protein [Chloroflexi bacterium]|nr:VWA domain-containing protein [Chloroflexota bacterium]